MDDLRERVRRIIIRREACGADSYLGCDNCECEKSAVEEFRAAVEAERAACADVARATGLDCVKTFAVPGCGASADVAASNTTYFIERALRARRTDNG